MDYILDLVKLATSLEKSGLEKEASIVDDVAGGLVKTAQYIGSQGYWIRNERCFQKCYRSKRASTPDKAAQEIWFECQKEFQQDLNKHDSEWNKYASNLNNKIKTASSSSQVDNILNQEFNIYNEELLNSSNSLIDLSNSLIDKDLELSKEASILGERLLKEAGIFDAIKGGLGAAKDLGGAAIQGVKNKYQEFDARGTGAKLSNSLLKYYNEVEKSLNSFFASVQELDKGIAEMAKSTNPEVQRRAQQAMQDSASLKNINKKTLTFIKPMVSKLINTFKGVKDQQSPPLPVADTTKQAPVADTTKQAPVADVNTGQDTMANLASALKNDTGGQLKSKIDALLKGINVPVNPVNPVNPGVSSSTTNNSGGSFDLQGKPGQGIKPVKQTGNMTGNIDVQPGQTGGFGTSNFVNQNQNTKKAPNNTNSKPSYFATKNIKGLYRLSSKDTQNKPMKALFKLN